jgi:hypothetical protein
MLGLFLLCPSPRAFCDGDGVDILPFGYGGDGGDGGDDARIKDQSPTLSSSIGLIYLSQDHGGGAPVGTMFPVATSYAQWQRTALSLANNPRLKGMHFLLGFVTRGAGGHVMMVYTFIEGGQGRVGKFAVSVLR